MSPMDDAAALEKTLQSVSVWRHDAVRSTAGRPGGAGLQLCVMICGRLDSAHWSRESARTTSRDAAVRSVCETVKQRGEFRRSVLARMTAYRVLIGCR